MEQEIMQFKKVSFGYDENKLILQQVSFRLLQGKTYALVGPTGGGKSTTASLMARLFDPTHGSIEFKDKDIRSYESEVLAKSIGFILQEPFLFSGTIGENIRYGNAELMEYSDQALAQTLQDLGLDKLIHIFDEGLTTNVSNDSDNISLGQKQLVSFIRTFLRKPELLILDEATANIDTITEQLLNQIIAQLPETTTKVIIAHRLNTIKDADEIFFVNDGRVKAAVDFDEALQLIDSSQKKS